MLWQIHFFPSCTHHVFLSHSREDREWLAFPLHDLLMAQNLASWLDCHDYPYGRTSFEALREGVLRSRHVVFLVTQAMLVQSRGWSIVELVWAHLLQENLREPGGELQAVLLPLFFLDPDDQRLQRSAWKRIRDRGPFHRPQDGDAVAWAARQISQFVLQGEQRGKEIAAELQQDSRWRSHLRQRPGLIERISARSPGLIFPPPSGSPEKTKRFRPRFLRDWLERHQHPVSFRLHLVGIPMTLVALGVGFLGWWKIGLSLFVAGYALQFLGHAIEGNDAGELILVKRLFGLPYVAVAPRPKQD